MRMNKFKRIRAWDYQAIAAGLKARSRVARAYARYHKKKVDQAAEQSWSIEVALSEQD